VTVIDMLGEEKIRAGGAALKPDLAQAGAGGCGRRLLCKTKLEDAVDEGAVVSGKDGARRLIPCEL
jgi:hypothetical protein